MNTKKRIFILFVGLTIIFSWTSKHHQDIKKAEWLIGTWEHKSQRGSLFETWSKRSDDELSGKSYLLKNQDTLVLENIRLVQILDNLLYIPTVKNQNNALPVRFTSKKISETQLVFENPHHDFPQIISYTKISADSLLAEISGIKNGQEQKQGFPMQRVK